ATYASRADGIDRNPHLGFYHSQLVTAKEVGAWSFSTLHRITHYNYQRALNAENKPNARFRWLNEVAVANKITDMFSISSLVDFLTYETRKTSAEALPNTRLEWTTTLDAEPMKNLAVSAGVTLTAPEQTLNRYSQEAGKTRAQSRLDNTKGILSVSYTFL
ncbi:MAG: hypothetical protein HYW85_04275, partial [Deltaproteobacteria bacterium]|nr:hypothetical protein [Deltaproteobacteria bacterium]